MKLTLCLILCQVGAFAAFPALAVERIDINTATKEELTRIIHIGDARALELIYLRPFASLDELVKIKGISEKRVADIKKQGLAWIGTTITEPTKTEPVKIEESPGLQENNLPSKLPIYLAAALIALFSGAAILSLKKSLFLN